MSMPLVYGLGSFHGDDQAGWLVIDSLHAFGYSTERAKKAAHPADLLDDLQTGVPLTVCDAFDDSRVAGAIRYWVWPTGDLVSRRYSGSHDLSLLQVLDLTRALDRSRLRIDIWGISGQRWSPADIPSEAVRRSAREVAARIWSQRHA